MIQFTESKKKIPILYKNRVVNNCEYLFNDVKSLQIYSNTYFFAFHLKSFSDKNKNVQN